MSVWDLFCVLFLLGAAWGSKGRRALAVMMVLVR